ncbi:TetR/AcrR family transcriptional regulator [Pseudonocardia sp. GCM10023141]|uniref:TetR/AcrR family transcriptional regulator n=1 Tax=Pseudonocardia sp. GCM10023141 TaxID=3252653 RepID=UPI00360915BB
MRDSAATRRALLDAARELFASDGYDATTVRAVADRAGVNQALLFRYFGNKEGLFAEAIRGRALGLLDGTQHDLLERTIDAVLDPDNTTEPFMAVLRVASSLQVGADLRAELGAAYTSAFAALADTDDPADAVSRAELLLAWLLGITVMRSIPGSPAPGPKDREHVLRAARALLGAAAATTH